MNIENNLKRLIEIKSGSVRAFSIEADIPYTTLRSILERGIMKANIENVLKIAHHLGMKPEQITNLGETNSLIADIVETSIQLELNHQEKVYEFAEHELEEQRRLQEHNGDYLGLAAAGEPIEGQQPVPFIGAKTINLLVNGDSMEPVFFDGDIIEYHPQPDLENGEIGVFAVNGGVTMKRIRKNTDIRLESLNKKYDDIVIKEADDFNILGKVIL